MEAPLTLYLALADDRDADLEVVSQAALAWAKLVRDAAHRIDPALDVSVKLHSTTRDSLSLNSLVKSATAYLPESRTVKAVLATVFLTTVAEFYGWSVSETLDWLFSDDAKEITEGLTKEEVEEIARTAVDAYRARELREDAARFYSELQQDDAIQGVGVTTEPGSRPSVVVPRSEFSERATVSEDADEVAEKRTRTVRQKIVLLRPVLVNDTERRWRFRSFTGEFSATIKDEAFLADILSGEARVPLMEGVVLDARIEAVEEREGQLWRATSYSILHVYGYVLPPYQEPLELLLEGEEPDTASDDDRGDN